jgi:hypothetical protein
VGHVTKRPTNSKARSPIPGTPLGTPVPSPAFAPAGRSPFLAAVIFLRSLPSIIETWMHCVLLTARGCSLPGGFKGRAKRHAPFITEHNDGDLGRKGVKTITGLFRSWRARVTFCARLEEGSP